MGAGDFDFAQFSQQCDLFSGGFFVRPIIIQDNSALDKFYQEVMCTSFCLDRNLGHMLMLWKEVFCRLVQIIL